MNEEQMSCQTPLDALISQDSLQIIKAAIPYMPLKSQQFLSIYAKVKNYPIQSHFSTIPSRSFP